MASKPGQKCLNSSRAVEFAEMLPKKLRENDSIGLLEEWRQNYEDKTGEQNQH